MRTPSPFLVMFSSLTVGAWRLLIGTIAVAIVGSLSQAAWAAPHGGGPGGGPGAAGMGMMGGQGPHGAGQDARHIERLLDSVNATPEQRTQIQQLVQAAKADGAGQREAGRKLHVQSQALFAQPTVDARAVETVRQQMLAQHDQASKRTAQLMIDVSRVLTPEQRKTLAERMAQRRTRMERHHSERELADRPPAR